MASSDDSDALPVHPHQLEVQEFESYGLIVDLRSAGDFREDHVPGAVSVPWSSPGIVIGSGVSSALVASEPNAGLPPAVQAHLGTLPPGATVLVYCDRGGRDSAALAQALALRGCPADVLPGGWPNYTRWVQASIETLARTLWFIPVRGAEPLVASVLAVLEGEGARVCAPDPSADRPASAWVDVLRRCDPQRPVWMAMGSTLRSMPTALQEALRHRPGLQVVLGGQDLPAPPQTAVGGDTLLRVSGLAPSAVLNAMRALPEPWPGRLQPDPDQSNP